MKACCALAPRCEFHHCRDLAKWSVWQPSWGVPSGQPGLYKFMCDRCWEIYRDAMTKPIPGITKPDHADDEWRPSLLECIRLADIAIKFEERDKNGPRREIHLHPEPWEVKMFGWTAAQVAQVVNHRRLMAKFGAYGSAVTRPKCGGGA